MTEEQCRKLVQNIIDTWPGGARAYVWRDVLIALDHHAADVTYRQLTLNATRPPTPGDYLLAYRSTRARLMEPTQLTLAPEEPRLGPDQYIATLRARAQTDPAAAKELEHWIRCRRAVHRTRTETVEERPL